MTQWIKSAMVLGGHSGTLNPAPKVDGGRP